MAEQPKDVVSVTPTKYNIGEIKTEFFAGSIETDEAEFGITVHQDGSLIALSAGTVGQEKPDFHTFHDLTPEQARQVADGLNKAADDAERAAEKTPERKERRSLIQKLLG